MANEPCQIVRELEAQRKKVQAGSRDHNSPRIASVMSETDRRSAEGAGRK